MVGFPRVHVRVSPTIIGTAFFSDGCIAAAIVSGTRIDATALISRVRTGIGAATAGTTTIVFTVIAALITGRPAATLGATTTVVGNAWCNDALPSHNDLTHRRLRADRLCPRAAAAAGRCGRGAARLRGVRFRRGDASPLPSAY